MELKKAFEAMSGEERLEIGKMSSEELAQWAQDNGIEIPDELLESIVGGVDLGDALKDFLAGFDSGLFGSLESYVSRPGKADSTDTTDDADGGTHFGRLINKLR